MPNTSNFSLPFPAASDTVDVPRDIQALASALDTSTAALLHPTTFRNVLINGAFDIWQRGTGSTSSPAGSRTFLADRWFVNPSGAAVTQARSTSLPTGARALYSLAVTGATSVTTVNIGQRIEALNVPQLKRQVTFSARIFNGSGASFIPSLLIGTPGASDDFTTVTNRLSVSLQSCANNAWTLLTYTVDISGYTNIDNGIQLELQIPSGSLNAGTKSVNVTELDLEPGPVNTPFERRPLQVEVALCQRYFSKSYNLNVAPGSNSQQGHVSGIIASQFTSLMLGPVKFPVEMRAVPTVTLWDFAGNLNSIQFIGNINLACTGADRIGCAGFQGVAMSASATAGWGGTYHYRADAEL